MRWLRALRGLDAKVVIAVASALVIVGAYWAAVSLSRDYYVVQSPPGSTFNRDAEGLSVLYRYLEALDVPVRTVHSFDALPEGGTMVIAAGQPFAKEATAVEGRALAEWVAAGNRLVLAGPHARDALRGAAIAGGIGPQSAPGALVEPRIPSAYVDGVARVSPGSARLLANGPEWVTHLGDEMGQVMVARAYGDGEIVWLSGIFPLSNEGLAEEDNARLATLLAATARPVHFDEYHHGFARGGGIWERLGAGGRASSVLALIAAAVAIAALAQRFGRSIEPAPTLSARSGAYIGSLAELYRKAGARVEALATLEEGLRLALVRSHGSEESGRVMHASAAEAIDGSAAARESGRLTEEMFMRHARALARARREVEGYDG